jgi:hypothetical protein
MSNTTSEEAEQIAKQLTSDEIAEAQKVATAINDLSDVGLNSPDDTLIDRFNALTPNQKINAQTSIEEKRIRVLNQVNRKGKKFNFVEKPAGVGGRNRKTRKNRKTKKSHKKRRSYSRRR